jgi:hypothetical protein
VDWQNPVGSQLGPDGAVAKYLRDTGVKPGMGLLDVYSAINAGGVGRYGASDANNGGAPGNVRDKVENQMAAHRQKAMALLGEMAPSYAGMADGPKGNESFAAPVIGSMMASAGGSQPQPQSQAIPAAVQALANPKASANNIFGMMAAQPQQQPQMQPVQIMGPSPEQANALGNFLKSLIGRPV